MSDVDKAAAASDALADNLHRAKASLHIALTGVEELEGRLYESANDASQITEQALSLATDPALAPVATQPGDLSAEQRAAEDRRIDALGVRLAAVRSNAEDLSEKVRLAQRVLYGPETFGVQNVAMDGVDSATSALTIAGNALDGLREVEGHNDRAADTLDERAGLLRNVVRDTAENLTMVGRKLENAQSGLAQLSRSGYLSTDQSPAVLARKIAGIGREVSADLSLAQRELARGEGKLDVGQGPASRAARDSAALAASKGFAPPVPEERRTNAGSAPGAAAGGAGRGRDKGSAHEV